VLDYARTDAAAYDAEVWRTALRLLPPRSPKRAAVVARIERIESQLAATLPQPGAP
jgi:cytochrome c-type biogenesis protein CcmH/NrfG